MGAYRCFYLQFAAWPSANAFQHCLINRKFWIIVNHIVVQKRQRRGSGRNLGRLIERLPFIRGLLLTGLLIVPLIDVIVFLTFFSRRFVIQTLVAIVVLARH